MEKHFIITQTALDILVRASHAPASLVQGLIQAALMSVRPVEAPQSASATTTAE